MSEIVKITGGVLSTNSYAITENGVDCVVIDCCNAESIRRFLEKKKLICRALLLTHVHFDHCGDAALLQREGAKIYLHCGDVGLIDGWGNLAETMGYKFISFVPDTIVEDNDEIALYGMNFKVVHTPGHTAGSVCYMFEDVIFSGDTLFKDSVGRTDFPTGSSEQLSESIREKLFSLNKDYKVYPGHGEPTRLFYERSNNRYV